MTKTKAEILYNRTTRFLLPALRLKDCGIKDQLLIDNGFFNCYIQDHEYDIRWDLEGCLFMVFKPKLMSEKFEELSELLRNCSNYRDEYDLEGSIIFVMEIPDKYKSILIPFRQGKYSEFDKRYVKDCIEQYIQGKLSKRWKVFMKDKTIKKELELEYGIDIGDQEVEDIPYAEDEILRYNPEIETSLTRRNE